jgi:hypothetical protein
MPYGLRTLMIFLAGFLLTVVYLRFRVRQVRAKLTARRASGDIVWGAYARQKNAFGWGWSGVLVMLADGTLVFEPDASSAQRGARVRTWLRGTAVTVGPRRRDITGARYRFVSPPVLLGEPEARYAATAFVGDLSTLEVGDDRSST